MPVDGVDVSAIDDDFFKREARPEELPEGRGTVTTDARKAAQQAVDSKLIANVNKVDMLKAYLEAKFTLNRSSRPHAMQF